MTTRNQTENGTARATHPARTSLEDLSASRIIAVLLGSILAIIGFFGTLIYTTRIGWHSQSGMNELPHLIIFGLAPLAVGTGLCWAGFRRGYEGVHESRIAAFIDRGLALVFGFVITVAGLVWLCVLLLAAIIGLKTGDGSIIGGLVFRGGFAIAVSMLGITILRKAF